MCVCVCLFVSSLALCKQTKRLSIYLFIRFFIRWAAFFSIPPRSGTLCVFVANQHHVYYWNWRTIFFPLLTLFSFFFRGISNEMRCYRYLLPLDTCVITLSTVHFAWVFIYVFVTVCLRFCHCSSYAVIGFQSKMNKAFFRFWSYFYLLLLN